MKKVISIFLSCLLSASFSLMAHDLPKLVTNEYGVKQLLLDNQPYVMLAGELMNSSASTLESMALKWQHLKDLNLNTILLAVTWEQLEPEEGQYDFAIVDGLIKEARKYDLKLVFLWFGSWKNGTSGYAPYWVMKDTKRFPRMRDEKGQNLPYLANFTSALTNIESKAFYKLMDHIRQIDSEEQTVLMVQVENEVGILGDSRDRSLLAETLFKKDVPEQLMKYIVKNEKKILPEIIEQWKAHGKKLKGSWEDVFGNESNSLADEMFMGWNYACHIQEVASAGKSAYPIPMFVNAWTIYPKDPIPGKYPSGGPNARMLDIYQLAAPAIDVLAVDNYNEDYISKLKEYDRNDNPIFVPEAVALFRGEKWSGPAKAFYTLAEYDAICFSPFAIDNYSVYNEKHPLREAYKVLKNLMPLIVKKHGTGQMRGFMQQENRNDKIDFGDYEMNIHYHATEPYEGYGLVIRLSEDEFLVSGYGINVSFNSKDRKRPGISYGTLREGYFVDGEWKTLKYLGGDEAMQGVGGVKMPSVYTDAEKSPDLITTVIIKVIPVEK